ncbi:MAG: hypothetical protein ACRD4P_08970, partial [Bryobacteraceae bacterium]
ARRFLELGIPSVRGNAGSRQSRDPGALPGDVIEWLKALPVTREWAGEILMAFRLPIQLICWNMSMNTASRSGSRKRSGLCSVRINIASSPAAIRMCRER